MTALQFQDVWDLNTGRAIKAAQGLQREKSILTRVNQFHYMLIQYMHRYIYVSDTIFGALQHMTSCKCVKTYMLMTLIGNTYYL